VSAGKTAAALRFVAMTALATALRRQLLPKSALLRLVNDGTLLPLLSQQMDEDWCGAGGGRLAGSRTLDS
jgi:hypothetical protein